MGRIRIWTVLLLLALPCTVFGQATEFKKAIKKNRRTEDGYYFVDLSRKEFDSKTITNFAKKNGYVIHNITTGTVSAYGNMFTIVKSVEMLPIGESPQVGGSAKVDTKVAADGGDVKRLIKRALEKGYKDGPSKRGIYAALTRSGISNEEIKSVCLEHGYQFIYTQIYRKDDAKKFVFFVPHKEMPAWVIKNSFTFPDGMPELKKGSVTLFEGETVDDIYWTGGISDGKINGSGVGAKFIDPETMLVFKGSFNNGKLAGKGYYRYGLPEKNGFFRIAGGSLKADGPTIMTTNYYLMHGAGEYAKTYPASDGVMRMERAYYYWSNPNNEARILYESSKGVYREGTRWTYVDENFHPLFNFPDGALEEVRGFKDGVAIVKHRKPQRTIIDVEIQGAAIVTQRKSQQDIWIEYNVTKSGQFSFSEEQKNSLYRQYDATIEYYPKLKELFREGFPSPADGGYLSGMNIPERIQKMDETFNACALDDPKALLAARYPSWQEDYETFRLLVRLYQLVFSDVDDYGIEWNFDSKVAYAKQAYERLDYGSRHRFNSSKYLNPNWMDHRLSNGKSIANDLRVNNKLDIPGKDEILDGMVSRMEVLRQEYEDKYYKAWRQFSNAGEKINLSSELKGEQIATERSTPPEGLNKHSPLIGANYYTYDKVGTIHFKKGSDFVNYNIVYTEEMKLDYYIITYCTLDSSLQKEYRTEEEMLKAIVDAYITKYR